MPSPRAIDLGHVADCLRRIRKADGYSTDAGLLVTLEPAPKLAEDDAPFVTVVWSRQTRPTDPALARVKRLTNVDIVAKVPAHYDEAQEQLDLIVQDIEDALRAQQYRFPTGYEFPQYQSAVPLIADPAAGWVGAVVSVTGHIPIHTNP